MENTLIDEMKASWGQTFEELNNSERLWMLFSLVGTMTADRTDQYDPYAVNDCVTPATERFHELSFQDQLSLALALINQIRTHYTR